MSDATTYGKACNRGDFWPNKKCKTMPWAGDPTPLTDALWSDEDTDGEAYVTFARNLERRMRAAERLLDDERQWSESSHDFVDWSHDVQAHLEAARKEDGQ